MQMGFCSCSFCDAKSTNQEPDTIDFSMFVLCKGDGNVIRCNEYFLTLLGVVLLMCALEVEPAIRCYESSVMNVGVRGRRSDHKSIYLIYVDLHHNRSF